MKSKYQLITVFTLCILSGNALAATGPKAPIGGKLTCRNIGRLILKAEDRYTKFEERTASVLEKYERYAERYAAKAADKKDRLEGQRDEILGAYASCFDNRADPDDDSRECKKATQKVANIEHKIGRIRLDPEETHKARVRDKRVEGLVDRLESLSIYIDETMIPFKDECEADVGDEDSEQDNL